MASTYEMMSHKNKFTAPTHDGEFTVATLIVGDAAAVRRCRWTPSVGGRLACVPAPGGKQGNFDVHVYNDNSSRVGLLPRVQNGVQFAARVHAFLQRAGASAVARVTDMPLADSVHDGEGWRVPCALTLSGDSDAVTQVRRDLRRASVSSQA